MNCLRQISYGLMESIKNHFLWIGVDIVRNYSICDKVFFFNLSKSSPYFNTTLKLKYAVFINIKQFWKPVVQIQISIRLRNLNI